MPKKKKQILIVRMERLPKRSAVERMREAYHLLSQATRKPIQEAEHEPVSSHLRQSVNRTTRTGSNDG